MFYNKTNSLDYHKYCKNTYLIEKTFNLGAVFLLTLISISAEAFGPIDLEALNLIVK